ncbi:MAG: hypothetical protein JWO32_1243 [Bacteroidetes bacterium]|nr:hypothetical protein [Bacteroidota bacterium]
MIIVIRWLRLIQSYCLFALFVFTAFNYKTSIYLFKQGKGQINILMNTVSMEEYALHATREVKEKLKLIEEIKRYSIDSLGYKPTENFTRVYDQKNRPVLWVLTVSEPYELKAYEWEFPLIGKVSYKGYFEKDLAVKASDHFKSEGYDVDLRSVSAWSTLGWFNDPVLSNTLNRSKGNVCELFFHELFHATYYAPNTVNFNENVASFIAHKATVQFLSQDTAAVKEYLKEYKDNICYRNFMLRQSLALKNKYKSIRARPARLILKLKAINEISDSLKVLPGAQERHFITRKKAMYSGKNAYFIDFEQYDSMQDSLEKVFNIIYDGKLKKMVKDLKVKSGNY